jgi:hypothetical protein
MRRLILLVVFVPLAYTASAQECSSGDFNSLCQTKAAVLRLLSYPAYSGSDEKLLNRAGDMAALAVISSVSMEDLKSPEKVRQVLLILNMAFAAPQLISAQSDRRPTAAMLLLEHLSKTDYDRTHVNHIENVRNEIQHNAGTGRPYELVTLKGEPPLDVEHTQWVASVLGWTYDIKPGMNRSDLLKVFTMEGGISSRTQRTYVLKGCPYIHVDVEFSPAGNKHGFEENPNDNITKISKPYLDFAHTD